MREISKEMMQQVAGGQMAESSDPSRAEIGGMAAAIGGGVGAAYAIEGAGGLAAMGSGAIAAGTAFGAGLIATAMAGWTAGTYAYEHSETVQEYSQGAVGAVVEYFQFDVRSEFQSIDEFSCGRENRR